MKQTRIKQAHNHDPAQAALFDQERAVARRGDPSTSHEAAKKQTPGKIRREHRLVLDILADHPNGLTDEALLAVAVGRGHTKLVKSGFATRRGELCPPRGKGVRDSGRSARTSTGARATVWVRDFDATAEVLPAAIRNLTAAQRMVYDLFARGMEITHGQIYDGYLYACEKAGTEPEYTQSSIRSRVSELVDLELIERKGAWQNLALWGLRL